MITIVIAIVIALCGGLSDNPYMLNDGPAGTVGGFVQAGWLNSFDFSSENPIWDDPAPPICTKDPISLC